MWVQPTDTECLQKTWLIALNFVSNKLNDPCAHEAGDRGEELADFAWVKPRLGVMVGVIHEGFRAKTLF
jgi:hypothetical protein